MCVFKSYVKTRVEWEDVRVVEQGAHNLTRWVRPKREWAGVSFRAVLSGVVWQCDDDVFQRCDLTGDAL